jgi:hypothetical protein
VAPFSVLRLSPEAVRTYRQLAQDRLAHGQRQIAQNEYLGHALRTVVASNEAP